MGKEESCTPTHPVFSGGFVQPSGLFGSGAGRAISQEEVAGAGAAGDENGNGAASRSTGWGSQTAHAAASTAGSMHLGTRSI